MSAAGIDTTEFKQVFHVETDRLIRRRLFWFSLSWLCFSVFVVMYVLMVSRASSDVVGDPKSTYFEMLCFITLGSDNPAKGQLFSAAALFTLWFFVFVVSLAVSVKQHLSSSLLINFSIALIVFVGLNSIGLRVAGVRGSGLWLFVLIHFIACCVFPWKPRQALIPGFIILPASLISKLTLELGGVDQFLLSLFAAVFMSPGIFVSWWKHSQRLQVSSNKFLSQRYGMLRQELAYARQIHEAMFPEPKTQGLVRFTYRYEPMRQIGGDYLYAKVATTPDGHETLSLVILDVTGHGIPAALTVNRLYGEIDLRFADEPDLSPGDLLGHLNRYVHLTLARHSIYATALCIRVDTSTGKVSYASGGHPPAFLRAADGTLSELASTTFVLGACGAEDFDPQTATISFKPGDTIVAYTDGATEARAPDGRMLRIDGLRNALIPGPVNPDPGEWPAHLLRMVANFRGGVAPEDDTLLVEIFYPLDTAARAGLDNQAHAGDENPSSVKSAV